MESGDGNTVLLIFTSISFSSKLMPLVKTAVSSQHCSLLTESHGCLIGLLVKEYHNVSGKIS